MMFYLLNLIELFVTITVLAIALSTGLIKAGSIIKRIVKIISFNNNQNNGHSNIVNTRVNMIVIIRYEIAVFEI